MRKSYTAFWLFWYYFSKKKDGALLDFRKKIGHLYRSTRQKKKHGLKKSGGSSSKSPWKGGLDIYVVYALSWSPRYLDIATGDNTRICSSPYFATGGTILQLKKGGWLFFDSFNVNRYCTPYEIGYSTHFDIHRYTATPVAPFETATGGALLKLNHKRHRQVVKSSPMGAGNAQ